MQKMPKLRIPVAPPGKVMKSAKDYDRNRQAALLTSEILENTIMEKVK